MGLPIRLNGEKRDKRTENGIWLEWLFPQFMVLIKTLLFSYLCSFNNLKFWKKFFSCGNHKSFSTVSGMPDNLKKNHLSFMFMFLSCKWNLLTNNTLQLFLKHNSHTLIELCLHLLWYRYQTFNLCCIIHVVKKISYGITISPKPHFSLLSINMKCNKHSENIVTSEIAKAKDSIALTIPPNKNAIIRITFIGKRQYIYIYT